MVALTSLIASAQSVISVKEEEHNDMEPTAQIDARKDSYGKVCALVIVHNIEPAGYQFEASGARVENATLKSGEKVMKVYLPEGTKAMRIKHSDTSIKATNYTFENAPLQSAQTYHLYLNPVFSTHRTGQQYLKFNINPSTAILEVEEDPKNQPGKYIPWTLSSGSAQKLMHFGTYKYQVRASDYYSSAGSVVVSNPTSEVVENVTLKPKFGYLTIKPTADLDGAAIFIDGIEVGKSSLSRKTLASGPHEVKITKRLFKMYDTTINVRDGEETVLTPALESNAARISLNCDDKAATIYMREGTSDRHLGTGSWNGPLEPGDYLIIVRRPGYAEATKQISVKLGGVTTFTLPALAPMYGSINVSSNPSGATITIDGKDVGVTPLVINNVLAGDHTVKVTKPGYSEYSTTVKVNKNTTSNVSATLTNYVKFYVEGSLVDGVYNDADGTKLTPASDKSYSVRRGTTVKVKGSQCGPGCDYFIHKTITRTINNPERIYFSMAEPLLHYKEFYWDFGYTWSGYSALIMNMGFTLNHFNMEFFGEYCGADQTVYRFPLSNDSNYYSSYANAWADATVGLRIGLSFRFGTRFRLTPQFGFKYIFGGNEDFDYDGTQDLMSLPITLRMNIQTGYRFSIFLAPEYQIALTDTPYTSILRSSDKNWNEGFAIHAGISFNF